MRAQRWQEPKAGPPSHRCLFPLGCLPSRVRGARSLDWVAEAMIRERARLGGPFAERQAARRAGCNFALDECNWSEGYMDTGIWDKCVRKPVARPCGACFAQQACQACHRNSRQL